MRLKGHKLDLTPGTERSRAERSSTGRCPCGWEESCSTQKEVRREYAHHLRLRRPPAAGVLAHASAVAVSFTPVDHRPRAVFVVCADGKECRVDLTESGEVINAIYDAGGLARFGSRSQHYGRSLNYRSPRYDVVKAAALASFAPTATAAPPAK